MNTYDNVFENTSTVVSQMNFKRIEKKFMLTPEQYKELMNRLRGHLQKDIHEKSEIYNIYYDTPMFSLIRKSLERPDFKEKIRLRGYGLPDKNTQVFIELKRKCNGVGYKRRVSMPYEKAVNFMNKEIQPISQTEKEIYSFLNKYNLKPVAELIYTRKAYYLKNDPSFRITFDENLRYRSLDDKRTSDKEFDNILSNSDNILMEIKTEKAIPLWMSELLNELKIYRAPFSKIGACYTNYLKGKYKNA